MSTLDASIVNVALAPIARDFGIAVDRLEWVVVTYALTLVALVPISGRISDLLGRTRVFTWGFIAFIVGSLLCSLAWNLPSLALFRALQGIGAAMIQGNSQAIITAIFPPSERGRAFGINGASVSAGIITGPVVGGWLTAWLGWRSIFWVNVPIGLIGFVLGRIFLPSDEKRKAPLQIDYRGALLFGSGIVLTMSGFGAAASQPWQSLPVAGALLAGAILLVAFARSQTRVPAPLMPPVIFQTPGVALGMLAAFISFSAGFTATFLTPYVIQQGLDFSVRDAGLVMTASPLAMLVTAPVSGYLSDRFGPRLFTLAGLATAATGLLLLSRLEPGWTESDLYWRLLLLGAGWGMFNSPNVSTIMSAVPRAVAGVTGGLNAVVRNLANTMAVALAALYFHWQSGGRHDVDSLVSAYQATLILAAALAAIGLIPAWLRRVPDATD